MAPMAEVISFDPDEKTLKGNAPVPLARPDRVAVLRSGSVAVFALVTINGVPQGERRFLFDVSPGEALFGVPSRPEGLSHQVIAVPYEECRLVAGPLPERCSGLEGVRVNEATDDLTEETLAAWLQQWSDRWVAVFENAKISLPGIAAIEVPDSAPLVDRLWQFHLNVLAGLHQLHEQETQATAQRFYERQRLNQQVSDRALGDLTAVFNPRQAEFLHEGGPLLAAVGAVARAKGISVSPPARSEDPERIKNPLDAIARSSRFRTRRVILTGKWWTADCGPLLAYAADDNRPLALLPKGTGQYEIFDPTLEQRRPLTGALARQLSPVGHMFYRAFPDQAMNSIDIFRFAMRGRERDLFSVLSIGILSSLVGMITPLVTGILITDVIPDAQRNLVWEFALCLLAASFGNTLFGIAQSVASGRLQTFADLETQSAVWDRLLKLRVSFFRNYTIGDLQGRVSAISQIRRTLSGTVLQTIFSSFFSALNLGLMIVYSPSLSLVALGITAVIIVVTNASSFYTRQQMRPLQKMQGELNGLIVQLIGGVSKLRIAGAEQRAFAFWASQFRQQLKLSLSTEAIEDGMTLFNTFLSTVSPALLFASASLLITPAQAAGTGPLQSSLSIGTFLAFNSAFGTFLGGATSLSNLLIQIMEISVLWERARPIIEEPPEVDQDKTDPGRLLGGVKLDRVSFRYQTDGPLTLDKISIEAKPGEFIALVGPSGSGKSTTVRLLLGFEQPEEGAIFYDGQDLSGLDVTAIRRQLGVVLQNGRINSDSIFENISGGALITMDEAWEAAKMAGFADDIDHMPMGMHTVISEGGTNLSGGQRQRLLIARALVLKPKILIFDEATSALDNRTQAIVSESLDRLRVTRIVIAHRLSTIRNADRIYVISAGQVIQQGNFETLMQEAGLFADLMNRQIM